MGVISDEQLKSMQELYDSNEDFKNYVDKNMQTYKKSKDDVFKMSITSEYKKSLEKGGCNESKRGKEEKE